MNATVMCERSIKPTNDDLFMNKRVAQKIELSPAFYPVQPLKGVMMSFFFFFSYMFSREIGRSTESL